MRYLKYVICFFIASVAFISCKNTPKEHDERRSEYLRPAAMDFTNADSTQILDLVNSYIGCLKNRDFETAATMLFTNSNDTVFPLKDKERENLLAFYNAMPIYNASIKSFHLLDRFHNEVELTIQITSHGDIAKEIGVTRLALRPVKSKDQWHLTLLDNESLRVKELDN